MRLTLWWGGLGGLGVGVWGGGSQHGPSLVFGGHRKEQDGG